MVVISIISFLSSIVLANLSDARIKAKNSTNTQQLKQIQNALEIYYSKHGQYPVSVSAPGWAPSIGQWTVDCSVNPTPANPTGFIIPELITDKLFPGYKEPSIDCSGGAYGGFSYGSNGKDYKLIALIGSSSIGLDRAFLDPTTDFNPAGVPGNDFCTLDGTNYTFYGVWTPGAKCWLQRWQCNDKTYCLSPDGITYN